MKKMIVSSIVLLAAGISSAIAGYAEPDQPVLDAFKKDFSTARNVQWEKEENYDKVTFGLAGHRVVAYYAESGELEAYIRGLFFEQLPLAVMRAVDKRFASAVILSVGEIANSNGTSYQLAIESKGKKYRIRLAPDGNMLETKKM